MKRIFYMLLAAALLAAGCTKEDNGGPIEELQIGIDNVLTKVALGTESNGKFDLLWSDGDEVAVTGDAGSSIFRLKSGAGTTNGVFEYKSGATRQTRITDVVYPASNAGNVPATQTYKEGTFDPSALTLAYHNPASTNVTKTEVCKSVQCCNITDASDHFPIYVDVTIGNSSLPLLEENSSLSSYEIVQETTL